MGCGECLSVCILDAVKYNWEEVESADLQERVAEHAHGVNQGKREKSFPLNFSDFYDPGMPWYWKKAGESLVKKSEPNWDPSLQLVHAEKTGLGSQNYKLITLPS